MDAPSEIERMKIDLEIATAKATLALSMLTRLIADLYRSGATRQTISRLASLSYIEETAGSDPALAIAAMELRSIDPDQPRAERTVVERAELERHRRNLLDAIRRDHQRTSDPSLDK